MNDTITRIMELKNLPLEALQAKYQELFGNKAPSNNKVYLWRKIAYRLQEIEYGRISTETQGKIEELIHEHDPINNHSIRPSELKVSKSSKKPNRDRRLPIPGTVIVKEYKGTKFQVKILDRSFEHNNKTYKTLSAIAKEITGSHWNGYLFFGL